MNSKIKQLEMRIKLGTGDEELDLVQSAALRDLMKVYESHINTLTAELDEARKEIAELRSAPGMEDVDFITKPYCGQSMQSACENHDKLADIAQRAIASRDAEKKRADETAELLKWLAEKSENWDSFAFTTEADSTESLGKVRRILEIVEGK